MSGTKYAVALVVFYALSLAVVVTTWADIRGIV